MHLRLPGHGEAGPTLEVFTYSELSQSLEPRVNRPGYGHLAFQVDSVPMPAESPGRGRTRRGRRRDADDGDGARVTWCYVTDPEGNILELQAWQPPA
jgi:catechol 2,3-dioxygenase-like lactoylglutathione lyase family enzyme